MPFGNANDDEEEEEGSEEEKPKTKSSTKRARKEDEEEEEEEQNAKPVKSSKKSLETQASTDSPWCFSVQRCTNVLYWC